MREDVDYFANRLEEFQKSLQAIPEVEQHPKTTLEVINRRNREIYWAQLLRYFLDPSEPHGFEGEVLDEVFKLISGHDQSVELEYQTPADVEVKTEVNGSQGNRIDLLVYIPDEWALCVELKTTSSERRAQTSEYYRDPEIPPSDIPTDSVWYIYISKGSDKNAISDAFINVSWREIVEIIDQVQLSIQGGATERGTAQLREFRDTIANEINMSDQEYTQRQREKMELYVKYYDEIQQAKEAFDNIHEREKNRWAERLIKDFKPDRWTEEWNCEQSNKGFIYKDGWRLDEDKSPVDNRSDAVYRLEFQHFLTTPRRFAEGDLWFRVYTSRHGVSEAYRQTVKELLNTEYYDQFAEAREKHGIEHVRGVKKHAEKHYYFDVEQGPEEAYKELSKAFDEFVELAPILTQVHEQAVEQATSR